MPKATTDADALYLQGKILIRLHLYFQSEEPYIALTRSLIEQRYPELLVNLAAIAERARAYSSFTPKFGLGGEETPRAIAVSSTTDAG